MFKDLWRFNIFDGAWTKIQQNISEGALMSAHPSEMSNASNTTLMNFGATNSSLLSSDLETNKTNDVPCVSPPDKVFAGFCSAEGKLFVFAGRDQKDGNFSFCAFFVYVYAIFYLAQQLSTIPTIPKNLINAKLSSQPLI
jgi:hypothetical protein